MKFYIIILFCLISIAGYSQCNSNLAILLSNQKSDEAIVIKKNHPVEVITRYQTFIGRINCIHPGIVEVEEAHIPLEDVEVIISRKDKFKPQNVAAVPMLYVGYGLGIAGSVLVGTGVDFSDEEYTAAPLIVGLAALAGSAILLYSGYHLKSGNAPEENPIYGLEEWRAEILPQDLARQKLRSLRE